MKEKKHTERLRDQLKEDLRGGNYWHTIKEDYSDVQEYFLDKEKKERLKFMKPISRFFHLNWWLLKEMIFKLSPVRRLLFVAGIFMSIFGNSVHVNGNSNNFSILGGLLLIFVLMLELKDKLLAKTELGEGRQVQQALMPNKKPLLAGWDIWLYTLPANDVGGDLVDFVERKDNTYFLTLGDVSGKGLGAALFSIRLQASLRTLANESFSVEEIISKVNNLFYKDGMHNRFASLIAIELKENSDNINFVNAGHMPPIIYRNGEITELSKGDLAVGLAPDPKFNLKSANLKNGETLILYSDGIIEAINEVELFYGKERFLRLIKKFGGESAERIGNKIIKDVDFFRNNYRMHDDISIAVIKRIS